MSLVHTPVFKKYLTNIEIEQTYTNLLQSSPIGLLHTCPQWLSHFRKQRWNASSGVECSCSIAFRVMSSLDRNLVSFRGIFNLRKNQRSHGAMSVLRQASYSPDMAPCDFWIFPQVENAPERDKISVLSRHHVECDGAAALHTTRGVPALLPKMAKPLREVCSSPTGLL